MFDVSSSSSSEEEEEEEVRQGQEDRDKLTVGPGLTTLSTSSFIQSLSGRSLWAGPTQGPTAKLGV